MVAIDQTDGAVIETVEKETVEKETGERATAGKESFLL